MTKQKKIRLGVIIGIILCTVLPFLLLPMGVSLESGQGKGLAQHLLLEWTSVMLAWVTAIFAFLEYRIMRQAAAPIMGTALFCAGTIDAFHALAAADLLSSISNQSDFIPFTWALSRMFNATVIFAGCGLIILSNTKAFEKIKHRFLKRFVKYSPLPILVFTLAIGWICLNSNMLPKTMFDGATISRPYDVLPLIIYLISGIWILRRFVKIDRGIFSRALLWSMLPAIAIQLMMAFGSAELYDHAFNAAHMLKILFYAIPFAGIVWDYLNTLKRSQRQIAELEVANIQLNHKNKELEQYTYITSHDLQEPLNSISNFSDTLLKDYASSMNDEGKLLLQHINGSSERLKNMVKCLLDHSRLGKKVESHMVDFNELLQDVILGLDAKITQSGAKIAISKLPKVFVQAPKLAQIWQNLISNAIKYQDPKTIPSIKIEYHEHGSFHKFSVKDNGIGFSMKYHNRIFEIFKRLHLSDEFDGLGIGLANCKKIISEHGGEIWAESTPGQGSTFFFTLPKN